MEKDKVQGFLLQNCLMEYEYIKEFGRTVYKKG